MREEKIRFLTKSYARFQWAAEFYYAEDLALTMYFDATEIPQGNAVSGILRSNPNYSQLISSTLQRTADATRVDNKDENLFGAVLKYLETPKGGLFNHLDQAFGRLRAPKYIKEELEIENGKIKLNDSVRYFYGPVDDSLDSAISHIPYGKPIIWVIDYEGTLIIGEDRGHPSLTGFKSARIAGELKLANEIWEMNFESGRYSRDYAREDQVKFLENAVRMFQSIFWKSRDKIRSAVKNE